MILPESLHIDWIHSNREKFHADPIIIEKVIRALVLLEALQSVKLNYSFLNKLKGVYNKLSFYAIFLFCQMRFFSFITKFWDIFNLRGLNQN